MPIHNGGHENNNSINLAPILRLTACPMHNLSDPKYNLYNLLFTKKKTDKRGPCSAVHTPVGVPIPIRCARPPLRNRVSPDLPHSQSIPNSAHRRHATPPPPSPRRRIGVNLVKSIVAPGPRQATRQQLGDTAAQTDVRTTTATVCRTAGLHSVGIAEMWRRLWGPSQRRGGIGAC